jgi:hypothetical protein
MTQPETTPATPDKLVFLGVNGSRQISTNAGRQLWAFADLSDAAMAEYVDLIADIEKEARADADREIARLKAERDALVAGGY